MSTYLPAVDAPRSGGWLAPLRRRLPLGLIIRRLLLIPVLVFIVATVSFFVLHLLPGDPARQIAGQYATPQTLHKIRVQLGIDTSVWNQYAKFVSGIAQGSLGRSYSNHATVLSEIGQRLPSDIELIAAALLFAVTWGLLAGVASAHWRGRWPDSVLRVFIGAEQATPDFVVGLVLIFLLAFKAGILPEPSGQLDLSATSPPRHTGAAAIDALIAGQWSVLGSALLHLVLPAVALGSVIAAVLARVTRAAVAGGLRSTQIEFARACGLRERTILRSAISMSRTSVITYLAMILGSLVGGTAIIESIFSWNGIGQWGLTSITNRDLPAIQGFVIVAGSLTLFIYVVLDVVVAVLDPRVSMR